MKPYSVRFIVLVMSFLIAQTSLYCQWEKLKGPYFNSISVLISADDSIYAGTVGGGLYKSGDNGDSWIKVSENFGYPDVYSLLVVDDNIYAGTNLGVYRSSDKGAVWNQSGSGIGIMSVVSLIYQYGVIIAGANGIDGQGVYASSNMGYLWKPSNKGLYNKEIYSLVSEGGILYACTKAGIYESVDNGAQWHSKNNGLDEMNISAFAAGYGSLFAAAAWSDMKIYMSSNQGNKWEAIYSEKYVSSVKALAVYKNYLIVGASVGIIVGDLINNKWEKKVNGLVYTGINCMLLFGDYIFIGTADNVVYRAKIEDVVKLKDTTSAEEPEISSCYLILKSFIPNPVSEKGIFKIELNRPGNVKIDIFDVFGRKVKEIYDGYCAQGAFDYEFDTFGFSPGIYFISAEAFGGKKSMKFEVIK